MNYKYLSYAIKDNEELHVQAIVKQAYLGKLKKKN